MLCKYRGDSLLRGTKKKSSRTGRSWYSIRVYLEVTMSVISRKRFWNMPVVEWQEPRNNESREGQHTSVHVQEKWGQDNRSAGCKLPTSSWCPGERDVEKASRQRRQRLSPRISDDQDRTLDILEIEASKPSKQERKFGFISKASDHSWSAIGVTGPFYRRGNWGS